MGNQEGKLFIDKYFSFGELAYGLGALCEKRTGCFVGFAGFLRCDYLDVDDFEFGFALHENLWAKGYATEIGRAQIAYGFTNLCALRLLAVAHPQNAASLRVLEKIGMKSLKQIITKDRGPRCVYLIEK